MPSSNDPKRPKFENIQEAMSYYLYGHPDFQKTATKPEPSQDLEVNSQSASAPPQVRPPRVLGKYHGPSGAYSHRYDYTYTPALRAAAFGRKNLMLTGNDDLHEAENDGSSSAYSRRYDYAYTPALRKAAFGKKNLMIIDDDEHLQGSEDDEISGTESVDQLESPKRDPSQTTTGPRTDDKVSSQETAHHVTEPEDVIQHATESDSGSDYESKITEQSHNKKSARPSNRRTRDGSLPDTATTGQQNNTASSTRRQTPGVTSRRREHGCFVWDEASDDDEYFDSLTLKCSRKADTQQSSSTAIAAPQLPAWKHPAAVKSSNGDTPVQFTNSYASIYREGPYEPTEQPTDLPGGKKARYRMIKGKPPGNIDENEWDVLYNAMSSLIYKTEKPSVKLERAKAAR